MLFLVLFLFYSAYFMLRYSTDPGPRRANMSAVYALFGVVLIPVSFLAIRLAEGLIHPVVFDRDVDENLASSQIVTFLVCLAGTLTLAAALYLNELRGKRLDARLRDLREAAGVSSAEKYVTAAYLVVLAVVLAWIAIHAVKLQRLEREVRELEEREAGRRARARARGRGGGPAVTEAALVLFWPAAFAYGEATVAYAGELVRPGRTRGLAIWGVRIGWLAQTALLLAQAASADGFPWGTWAGSLNLFVWMCVGAYLVWGCRSSFALLGLGVMPLALVLFVLAWAAGGAGAGRRTEFGDAFLAAHVGLVLAAFAGFTLAAALAGLYLWQERRLKRRASGVLRLRAPSLASLDRLTARTIAVALPLLTVGIGIGFARLEAEGAASTRSSRSRSSRGSSTPPSSSFASSTAGAAAGPPGSRSQASSSSSSFASR